MKRWGMMLAGFTAALMASAGLCAGQAAGTVANPVSTTVKESLARFEKNMVGAADLMPEDKFNFKPTPEMNTFAHLTMHIAQSNNFLCAKISGQEAPKVELKDTDSKEKLVGALKASFEYCGSALAGMDDSKLGDPLPWFGGRTTSRAGAMIALTDDWEDHYSAQAVYLRLNGILPPTAKPKK
ncbi:MAG: DinB family protein [Candidatus Acidiferrum sp.]